MRQTRRCKTVPASGESSSFPKLLASLTGLSKAKPTGAASSHDSVSDGGVSMKKAVPQDDDQRDYTPLQKPMRRVRWNSGDPCADDQRRGRPKSILRSDSRMLRTDSRASSCSRVKFDSVVSEAEVSFDCLREAVSPTSRTTCLVWPRLQWCSRSRESASERSESRGRSFDRMVGTVSISYTELDDHPKAPVVALPRMTPKEGRQLSWGCVRGQSASYDALASQPF